MLEQPHRLPVINRASIVALGANQPNVAAWLNINAQGFHAVDPLDSAAAVNERLESFDVVQ